MSNGCWSEIGPLTQSLQLIIIMRPKACLTPVFGMVTTDAVNDQTGRMGIDTQRPKPRTSRSGERQTATTWGVKVLRYEIRGITPPKKVIEACDYREVRRGEAAGGERVGWRAAAADQSRRGRKARKDP